MPIIEGFIALCKDESLTPELVTRRLHLGKRIVKLSDLKPEHEILIIAFLLDKVRDANKAIKKLREMDCPETAHITGNGLSYWKDYRAACVHMLHQTSMGKEIVDAFNL